MKSPQAVVFGCGLHLREKNHASAGANRRGCGAHSCGCQPNKRASAPPSRNESAQVPHKHRQTRRIRFRLNVIPFVEPAVGVPLFAAAPVKDTVNRIGGQLDDGQPNQSLKALSFTVPARECIGACR